MSDPDAPIDWDKYRKRIEHEDGLLNARVNIFLVLNGMGAVALGVSKSETAMLTIAIITLAINIMLGLCTLQSAQVIRDLTLEYIHHAKDPIDNCVRKTLKKYPRKLLPNVILGMWLPLLLCVGWFMGIVAIFVNWCDNQ